MALQNGDFVKLDFTGIDAEDGSVFDTTKEDIAKEHDIHDQRMTYEPITVCIGEGHVLPGLDKQLIGKDEESSFEVTLKPEEAFGKKDASLIKLMPLKQFKKQDLKPQPGLDVSVDGMRGTVKTVSGNRVIVDFNHPLASHDITYKITTRKKVEDLAEQVKSLIEMGLRFTPEVKVKEKTVTITTPTELPEQIREQLTEQVKKTTAVEKLEFAVAKKGDTQDS